MKHILKQISIAGLIALMPVTAWAQTPRDSNSQDSSEESSPQAETESTTQEDQDARDALRFRTNRVVYNLGVSTQGNIVLNFEAAAPSLSTAARQNPEDRSLGHQRRYGVLDPQVRANIVSGHERWAPAPGSESVDSGLSTATLQQSQGELQIGHAIQSRLTRLNPETATADLNVGTLALDIIHLQPSLEDSLTKIMARVDAIALDAHGFVRFSPDAFRRKRLIFEVCLKARLGIGAGRESHTRSSYSASTGEVSETQNDFDIAVVGAARVCARLHNLPGGVSLFDELDFSQYVSSRTSMSRISNRVGLRIPVQEDGWNLEVAYQVDFAQAELDDGPAQSTSHSITVGGAL